MLIYLIITIWYIDFAKISSIFMMMFFSACIFISIFSIIEATNKIDSDEDVLNNIRIYGIIGGTFFYSSLLTFIIVGFIKFKTDKKLWINYSLKHLKILIFLVLVMFLIVIFWSISYFVWRNINTKYKVVQMITPSIIMISEFFGMFILEHNKKKNRIQHSTLKS